MTRSDRAIVVMAREPLGGQVKTRLVPSLGADGAARLYESFLRDTIATAQAAPNTDIVVSVDAPTAVAYVRRNWPEAHTYVQPNSDFGDRLASSMEHASGLGYDAVLALGSDCPHMPSSRVDEAFDLLREYDVVLGPADDGGYYLIAWQTPHPEIVRPVRMSTPDVYSDTVALANDHGLILGTVAEDFDVDDGRGLALLDSLLRDRPSLAPSSALTLNGNGRPVVVLPALNEAESVGAVISGLHAHGHRAVVVVDNGSTDDTATVARSAGADVVHEPRRGYGYACAAGSRRALDVGASHVVFMDADGSSDAAELRSLLDAAGSSRLVQGSRTLGTIVGGAMPPHQRAGNRVTSALMRRLYSARVTDLGPFRVIEAGLLAELDMTEMTFGWPTEMTVKALRRGVDVVEVPVTWRSRTAGRSKVGGSLAGSVLAGWHIMRVTLRHARRR